MTTPHTAAPLGVERTAPDLAAIEARAAAAAHAAREYRYCRDCGAVDSSGRAGWMCRTCGTILPSDCPDAKATAIAAKVARDLGCADLDDVPDALKRVLADNADAEIHRRVLTEQSDAQRTRADAAEAEVARLTTEREGLCRAASHARQERTLMAEELATVREERDALRETVADLAERMEDAHDGGEVVALQAAEHRAAADALRDERDAARRAATLAETERDGLRALTDSMRADNGRLRAIVESVRAARAVSAAAAARYTAAWDAVGTLPPTAAQSEEIAAALRAAYEAGDALTAALDAAGEGR